jgi:chemotaxis response regulator CheB
MEKDHSIARGAGAVPPSSMARPTRAPGPEGGTLRVFVADDAPSTREQLSAWARGSDGALRVEAFPNARQLLRRVEYDPPDLALVDLDLPGLDGLTTLRQLRARGVTVVMLSACTIEAARGAVEGLCDGAADCLWKRCRDGRETLAITRARFLARIGSLVREGAAPLRSASTVSEAWQTLDPDAAGRERFAAEGADPFAATGPWCGVALAQTRSLGRLIRHMARVPERVPGGLLIGVPLPRRVTRVLAECVSRHWQRVVLELKNGEALRPGQWRVIPGRSLAQAETDAGGTSWRLRPMRDGVEGEWIARQVSLLDASAVGSLRLFLFDPPDERIRSALATLSRQRSPTFVLARTLAPVPLLKDRPPRSGIGRRRAA